MLIDQISQLVHRLGALHRCPSRPFALERCSCSGYGGVDIGLTSHLDVVRYKRLVMGTVETDGLAGLGVNVLRSSGLVNVLQIFNDGLYLPRC
jgi:hypothetical protein